MSMVIEQRREEGPFEGYHMHILLKKPIQSRRQKLSQKFEGLSKFVSNIS